MVNDILAIATKSAAKLEAMRKEAKAPILDMGRDLDGCFAPAAKEFTALKREGKKKLDVYLQKEEEEAAKRLAEAAAAREEAERKRLDALGAGDEKAVENASAALIQAHEAVPDDTPVSGVTSEYGKTSVRMRKVATLVDITQVPREWLEQAVANKPDELLRLIKKAGKAVPGVALEEERSLAVRAF